MTDLTPSPRWTPVDLGAWTRCAYGHCVMLQSNGGTLRTTVETSLKQVILKGVIENRMLIEVYRNGELLFDKLVATDNFDCSIDLTGAEASSSAEIEVHFIPATFGTVWIARDISDGTRSKKRYLRLPRPDQVLSLYSFA
ncbi:MAG: hypothetical protein GQ539_13250 [Sulfitobacter sp.]|nr:hypothetical protein [Sulfitobacter sp.]